MLVCLCSFFLLIGAHKASANHAWAVIDADTGRLLEGSNEHARLPIASLTKIWTALTVLESAEPFGETTISAAAAISEGSSLYLKQGSVVNTKSLLYGLMLRSGNDAAYALAEYAGGSVEGFTDLMNEKALYYGLKDTVFKNPSGLHHEEHLSTAYETAQMMRFAMENEQFNKIASTQSYKFKLGETTYHWANKHRLIHSVDTAIAGKTGFTKAAGRTLVTYFEKDKKRIIVVTLNDGNDWQTHMSLAEKVFSSYKIETVAQKGRYKISPDLEGELAQPIRLLMKKGEAKSLTHLLQIPQGETKGASGQWIVYDQQMPIYETNIKFLD